MVCIVTLQRSAAAVEVTTCEDRTRGDRTPVAAEAHVSLWEREWVVAPVHFIHFMLRPGGVRPLQKALSL